MALLFAGSSSTTIGNPIGDVLSALDTTTSSTITFVGGTCSAGPSEPIAGPDQAAIVIYIDKTQAVKSAFPKTIDGVPVQIVKTEPFVAF